MLEFSVCGVRCRLSLLFSALLTVLLLCQPDGMAVVCMLASLIHEGGHLLAMVLVGVPPERCTLSAFGARIEMGYHKITYVQNFVISVAGPLVNGIAAVVLWRCGALMPATAHLVLAVLNLLPSMALDGGQLLCCGLCMVGLAPLAERILQITSAITLLLLASINLIMLFRGSGNLSLLVISGYLAALTFFSDKMQKNS